MLKLICIIFALFGLLAVDTGSIQIPRTDNSKYLIPTVKWTGEKLKGATVKTMDIVADYSEDI